MTIKRYCMLIFATAMLFIGCGREEPEKVFSERMEVYLELIRNGEPVTEEINLFNPELILEVYSGKKNRIPQLWADWENVDQLLNSIRNSYFHGLRPGDYHLSAIYDHINLLVGFRDVDPAAFAAFDLLLTDAFLLLGAHLADGKVDPDTVEPVWNASDANVENGWKQYLEESLNSRQVAERLEQLAPAHHMYASLTESLEWHRQVERNGGWKLFLPDTTLAKGIRHDDVKLLWNRLDPFQEHHQSDNSDIRFFDDTLEQLVIMFQKGNGLRASGVVDRATVDALNVSIYDRIPVIKANLDRWRTLEDPADHYLMVNIPEYELSYVKGGKTVLTLPVIVGSPDRATPVFSSEITKIELNPFWFVPPGMMRRNILPAIRRDSTYLERRNLEVLDENWRRVDPASVDWNSGFNDGFPYIIRQRPGPDNEMGTVKFLFPNRYFVTMHGTPYLHQFNRQERALSNGCIRIRTPVQLAATLLGGQDDLNVKGILEIIDEENFTRVDMDNPIRIHVFYFTSWVDEHQVTHFRRDVYQKDTSLIAAMEQSPPHHDLPLRIEFPTGMAVANGRKKSGR
jgi:L,D-transpeptidase YcbB